MPAFLFGSDRVPRVSVNHPALGAMEIFVVPIGPLDGGNGYETVFT
jgi:hypothetical protein